ncbi:hypothetical protein V2J09_000927 [Rumex salicifolius]
MIPPPIFPYFPNPIKPEEDQDEVLQGDDYFDLLPDPIVGVILNRLQDAKSLCRCILVSKRFASLVPQVDSVSVVAKPRLSASPKRLCSRTFLKSLFRKFLFPVGSAKKSDSKPNIIGPGELSHWISSCVKNFAEIRHLRVQLPDNGGIVGFPDTGGMLKWNAEFGEALERCAIIGATTFEKPSVKDPNPAQNPSVCTDPSSNPAQNQSQNGQLLTDLELKSRVVWILSCLIAACARHGVVKQTLIDCLDLRSAVVMDARHQGRLSMNEKQIKDLKDSFNSSSAETDAPIWKRTTVPNVVVKLWYAPELVLARSGYVMKGATVVAIRPATGGREDDGATEKDCELQFKGGFGGDVEEEEVIGEAVKEILKRTIDCEDGTFGMSYVVHSKLQKSTVLMKLGSLA